jgi:hypothetical protein
MTLIASTLNHKMPFLISDLLWSSKPSNTQVRFPTNISDPSPHLPANQENKPIKLLQKMYFIKNNVCIIFAGESDEILAFLIVIKSIFQNYSKISKNDIHQFLNKYNLEQNYKESAFFITHIENFLDDSINVSQFYYPSETNIVNPTEFNIQEGSWNIMYDPIYEEVSACGGGAEGFLNIIKQFGIFHTRFENGDFMQALQANTILISQLLTLERVSLYTLRENWGGGFEIAYYNGEKFEKLNEIAYVINHSQFDISGDIGLPIPMLIMYYKYVNDILYIVALEVRRYSIKETEMYFTFISIAGEFHTTLYEVEGIDLENIEDYELPSDFSFSTNKISMGYSLITKENSIYNPAFFNGGSEVSINFKQGEKIEVVINKKIVEDIKNIAKEIFTKL